jgi:two-component system nitrogen regulation response regulator GlnG
VRILAATHRDLETAVSSGMFREDLLYRLRVVPIQVPPLRERPEDVAVLAEHFIRRYAEELTGELHFLSEAALERLSACEWPGNVRELENAIKRALVLTDSEVLSPEDFAFLEADERTAASGADLEGLLTSEVKAALADPRPSEVYRRILERVERPLLETVLAHTGGNQIKAAALLGINRNTLRKKITDLDISVPGRS